LKHEFPRGLANPRQMQPYTYSESVLTPYAGRDVEFAGGPVCGSVAPNAKRPDGSHLLDQAGIVLTAILFSRGAPSTDALSGSASSAACARRSSRSWRPPRRCSPATSASPTGPP